MRLGAVGHWLGDQFAMAEFQPAIANAVTGFGLAG